MKTLIATIGLIALTLTPSVTKAEIIFRVTVPVDTDPGATVYIAGDFQGWQPGQSDYALTRVRDHLWEISLPLETGKPLQFKFTLGDWEHVEKGPGGEEIQNRLHRVTGGETLELQVATWARGEPRLPSLTGDITLITVPGFLEDRRVWVYLPPGYHEDTERRYPVLYMFDGQNVFDDATSYAGEWRVDETLEELIPAGTVTPLIVVAVANGEDQRGHEYTPWYSERRDFGGGGGEHLQTWIDVLLPHVNANYRTLTGPENTGLAGSSFGGLMTLYGGYAHGDVFGRCGVFSPTTMFAGGKVLEMITARDKPGLTLYVDMGSREGGHFQDKNGNGTDDAIDSLHRLRDILTGQGFIGGWDLLVVEGEGHRHNESYWAQRFSGAVQFLFPAEPRN